MVAIDSGTRFGWDRKGKLIIVLMMLMDGEEPFWCRERRRMIRSAETGKGFS